MMKIRIAIPAYGGLTPHTKKSVENLLNADIDGVEFDLQMEESNCNLADARCALVNNRKSMRKKQSNFDFDKLLFVDDDIEFTPGMVQKLISHDKDIVSGLYPVLSGEDIYNAGQWGVYKGEEVIGGTPLKSRVKGHFKGLCEVQWIGVGFCLIDKAVFQKIEYPWFYPIVIEQNNNCVIASEDMIFCDKINKSGYTIYVDCNVRPKHYKSERLKQLNKGESMSENKMATDNRNLDALCMSAITIIQQLRSKVIEQQNDIVRAHQDIMGVTNDYKMLEEENKKLKEKC